MFLVILQEPQQIDLNNRFDSIFSEFSSSEQVSFNVNYVQVDREQPDESFSNCE